MKNLALTIVAGLVLVLLIYQFAPGIWANVDKTVRDNIGWTEEAKRQDPIRYLEYILNKTRSEYTKIDQYIAEYRTAIRRLEKERAKAQTKADAANGLLNELKTLYKSVQAGDLAWPIEFRGGSYGESQFKTQIGTLLAERDAQTGVVDKLAEKLHRMGKRLDKIRTARVEYTSKLSVLESDLAVAKANVGSAELDELIGKADEILAYVDESSTDFETPLRSAKELLESESNLGDNERQEKINEFLGG